MWAAKTCWKRGPGNGAPVSIQTTWRRELEACRALTAAWMAKAVLPTPGGPYISVTEPQGRPPLDVIDLLGWRAESRVGRPVGMLDDREAAFCRASDAEMVGRRSGPCVNLMHSVTHAPGNLREEDEFEKFVMSSWSSIASAARRANDDRPAVDIVFYSYSYSYFTIQRFCEHEGIKNNKQGSVHTLYSCARTRQFVQLAGLSRLPTSVTCSWLLSISLLNKSHCPVNRPDLASGFTVYVFSNSVRLKQNAQFGRLLSTWSLLESL